MPKKTFAMERAGPSRVEVEWRGMWKGVRVRADGAELGVFANKTELEAGREFSLPAGGVLAVQLVRGLAAAELRVMKDGVSLLDSTGDPAERVKQAARMLYYIAAVSVVLGALVELAGIEFFRSIGAGWASVGEGAVFALLGWQTSKRSRVALSLGIGLFALDTVLLFVHSIQSTHGPSIVGPISRLLFFVPLVNGLRALRDLRTGTGERTSPSVVEGGRDLTNLDGWDALLLVVGMVVGSAVLVAMHSNLNAQQIGAGTFASGIVPIVVRQTFWPPAVQNPSRHTFLTLVLVGVGGFVTLAGLIIGALFTMFLMSQKSADPTPATIVIIPIGVLLVGGFLIFTGMQLARKQVVT